MNLLSQNIQTIEAGNNGDSQHRETRKGGKIRLPAPKNIENNVRLSRIRFFLEHFFIKLSFLFDPQKNRPTKDGLTAVPP